MNEPPSVSGGDLRHKTTAEQIVKLVKQFERGCWRSTEMTIKMLRSLALLLFAVVQVRSSSVRFAHIDPVRPPVWGAAGAAGWPGAFGRGVGGASDDDVAAPSGVGGKHLCRFFPELYLQRSYAEVLLPGTPRWTVHWLRGHWPVRSITLLQNVSAGVAFCYDVTSC